MPQIIPIKDLKNTSEISDMCHKADRGREGKRCQSITQRIEGKIWPII